MENNKLSYISVKLKNCDNSRIQTSFVDNDPNQIVNVTLNTNITTLKDFGNNSEKLNETVNVKYEVISSVDKAIDEIHEDDVNVDDSLSNIVQHRFYDNSENSARETHNNGNPGTVISPVREKVDCGRAGREDTSPEEFPLIPTDHQSSDLPLEAEAEDDDTRCGVGSFHPSWLQKLASKKTYVIIHGLMGMSMFSLASYFVATITTLEKRFKIQSRTAGIICVGWEVGVLLSSLVFGYLGSRGNKIRLMTVGLLVTAFACFVCLMQHLLYGPGQDALELTLEYGAQQVNNRSNVSTGGLNLCGNVAEDAEDCYEGNSASLPVMTFFFTQFLLGIGDESQLMLGITYLDDNTRKDKAPIFLALSACIRMLGSTVGFTMASYALAQYVDPSLHPTINKKDPRWIGAWWMGWAPGGVIACILAAVVTLFPKQLPRTKQRKAEKALPAIVQRQVSFKDFRLTLGRMLHNKVLMLNTLSAVFFMFGYTGYWTFMPKYMETQFGQTAASASLISGSVSLVFTGLGIASSAVVISKFKPSARHLAAWTVFVEILDVIGHFSWTFLSCDSRHLHGNMAEDKMWNLSASCNADCYCSPTVKYSPICSLDGSTTFFSPCHAGCSTSDFLNETRIYSNCSCIPDGQAVDGSCPTDCGSNFTIFIVTQCIMRLLGASGKAANTLISFRCVDEEDKAFSIGFSEFLFCIMAFIPGPIVYGYLLDSACIVWGQTCGHTGNCWLYNGQTLRYLVNFTATGLLSCGALFDMGVWYYVKDLNIYDEHNAEKPVETKSTPPEKGERPSSKLVSSTT